MLFQIIVLKLKTGSSNLPPQGSALKENKLDCFEHKHTFCSKLQCAIIVYLLCTALWWQIDRCGGPLNSIWSWNEKKTKINEKGGGLGPYLKNIKPNFSFALLEYGQDDLKIWHKNGIAENSQMAFAITLKALIIGACQSDFNPRHLKTWKMDYWTD